MFENTQVVCDLDEIAPERQLYGGIHGDRVGHREDRLVFIMNRESSECEHFVQHQRLQF